MPLTSRYAEGKEEEDGRAGRAPASGSLGGRVPHSLVAHGRPGSHEDERTKAADIPQVRLRNPFHSPSRRASAAAWVRPVTFSFARMLETCTLAVFGEMNSA